MPKKKQSGSLIGSFAFLIGVVLAIAFGFVSTEQWMQTTLVIIGIIVGLLNITANEAMGFLAASTALVIVSALSGDIFLKANMVWASNILYALLFVFVPATIIVALRAVFSLARN